MYARKISSSNSPLSLSNFYPITCCDLTFVVFRRLKTQSPPLLRSDDWSLSLGVLRNLDRFF